MNTLAGRALRPSAVAALSAGLILLVAWLAVGAVLHAKWRDEIGSERRQNENLSNALTEQTLRVLAAIDQAMLRVDADLSAADERRPDLVRYASETGLTPNILVQLSLIGADGRLEFSNLDPDGSKTNHVDLSEREHVRVHLHPEAMAPSAQRAPARGLFIGKPVIGKVSRKWTIQISRKVVDARGRTRGVIVASLDPAYFEDVFRRVELGRSGGVALIGADMTVRARVIGGFSRGVGSSLPSGSALERETRLSNQGSFVAPSGLDGVSRIIAFRRVADYPLFLTVSTGEHEALEGWRETRDMMVGLAAFLSLVVVVAAANFALGLRRLEQSNDALRASEAKANAANQAKTEFLCAMSHELRTPLTSIRGFAELMEHRLSDPRQREQAGLIRKGAEYLNTLLSEILDMAKVEAGAMELAPESLELRPLVSEIADYFALAANEKGLQLRSRVEDDVPGIIVCDGLRLKQILNNLLSNAVKFTESGSVQLGVAVVGRELSFAVVDTGQGIPPEKQELIFEKFRQGDARVSYEHGGTGLGLPLSRGLAALMDGQLTLRSVPGEGACFTLLLPLRLPQAAPAPPPRAGAATADAAH